MLRQCGTPRNGRLAYAATRMAREDAAAQQCIGSSGLRLQAIVFFLVAASFTAVYITQPVLPVLQVEFGVSETTASLTVSAVILGIALANLPFGVLADRYPIRPILLGGATVVSAASLLCVSAVGQPWPHGEIWRSTGKATTSLQPDPERLPARSHTSLMGSRTRTRCPVPLPTCGPRGAPRIGVTATGGSQG